MSRRAAHLSLQRRRPLHRRSRWGGQSAGAVPRRRPYCCRIPAPRAAVSLVCASQERRLAPRTRSDAGAGGRRPRSAWVSAGKRRPRQGPGVCWKGAAGGKCDPSRGGGGAHGTRAGGRGGRGALRGCAGGAPGRRGPTAAGRQRGRRASSRRGRGRTTGRRRTAGGTRGRFSRGGAGPRRRSSRGEIRLDNRAAAVAQRTGRLSRSVGARGGHEGPGVQTGPSPTPASSRSATRSYMGLSRAHSHLPCPAKGRRASTCVIAGRTSPGPGESFRGPAGSTDAHAWMRGHRLARLPRVLVAGDPTSRRGAFGARPS